MSAHSNGNVNNALTAQSTDEGYNNPYFHLVKNMNTPIQGPLQDKCALSDFGNAAI